MKRVLIVIGVLIVIVALVALAFISLFPRKYLREIDVYAEKYGLPNYLVASVINIESRYEIFSKSSAEAMGLMQLKLSTAEDMARGTDIIVDESSIFDKDINIELGCKYLQYLLNMFSGSEINALASYNWGLQNVKEWIAGGNIDKFGNITNIPVRETKNYLKKYKVNKFVYRNIYKM